MNIDQSSEYNQTKVWKHIKTTRFFLGGIFNLSRTKTYIQSNGTESQNIQDLYAFLLSFPLKGEREFVVIVGDEGKTRVNI